MVVFYLSLTLNSKLKTGIDCTLEKSRIQAMKRRSFLQAIAGAVAALPLLSLLPAQAQAKTQEWLIQWKGTPRKPEPPVNYRVEFYNAEGQFVRAKHVSNSGVVYTAKEQDEDGIFHEDFTMRMIPLTPTDVRVSRL